MATRAATALSSPMRTVWMLLGARSSAHTMAGCSGARTAVPHGEQPGGPGLAGAPRAPTSAHHAMFMRAPGSHSAVSGLPEAGSKLRILQGGAARARLGACLGDGQPWWCAEPPACGAAHGTGASARASRRAARTSPAHARTARAAGASRARGRPCARPRRSHRPARAVGEVIRGRGLCHHRAVAHAQARRRTLKSARKRVTLCSAVSDGPGTQRGCGPSCARGQCA